MENKVLSYIYFFKFNRIKKNSTLLIKIPKTFLHYTTRLKLKSIFNLLVYISISNIGKLFILLSNLYDYFAFATWMNIFIQT